MSEKLFTSQKSITGPSFPTETVTYMDEIGDSVTDEAKKCINTTKKCTADLQAKAEKVDAHEDTVQDETSEDEINDVREESREIEINSAGEIKQAKSGCQNDTHTGKDDESVRKSNSVRSTEKSTTNENRYSGNSGTRSIGVGTGGGSNHKNQMDEALIKAWSELKLKENREKEKNGIAKEIGLFALKTAALSGIILGGTALIVPAIGFGAAGVTGGSLAALYQSTFLGGTIASGSAFATLQSIGAAGLSAAANTAVVAGSAAVSGAHSIIKNKKND